MVVVVVEVVVVVVVVVVVAVVLWYMKLQSRWIPGRITIAKSQ